MAGDWIKIRIDLSDDPNVYMLSDILSLEVPTVVGHLTMFWGWMDRHTVDGKQLKLTENVIDKRIGVDGFADALRSVGWLEGENMALTIPKFDRHNGVTAQARALESEAKRLRRQEKEAIKNNVGQVSDKKPQKCPTREEENREEKRRENNNKTTPASPSFDDSDMEFSEYAEKTIRETTNPDLKKPNLESWAKDVRLMRERDNRSRGDIRRVWDWARQDPFWKTNILSISKFRQKFDQLSAASLRQKTGGGQPATDSQREADVDNWVNGGSINPLFSEREVRGEVIGRDRN